MDPLSFTASLLTVIGLGAQVARTVQRLVALKGAPGVLLALNNEISDLNLVIKAIDDLTCQRPDSLDEKVPHNSLLRAKGILLKLEKLVEYRLTVPDGDGGSKLDGLVWFRDQSKV